MVMILHIAIVTLFFFVSVHAQETPDTSGVTRSRTRLDIPDSVVITGSGVVHLQIGGNKLENAYGYALPQMRPERKRQMVGLGALPNVDRKAGIPTPVPEGRGYVANATLRLEHWGNAELVAGGRAEISGWQLDGEVGLSAGRGHRTDAGFREIGISLNAQRHLPYRSTGMLGVSVLDGSQSIWAISPKRTRKYARQQVVLGGNYAYGSTTIHTMLELDRRTVSDELAVSETGLVAEVNWQRTSGRFLVRGSFGYDRMDLSRGTATGGVTSITRVGAEALTRPEERYGGGAGVTLFSTDPYRAVSVVNPEADSVRKIYPTIFVWARLAPWLKAAAHLSGGVERFGLWEAYEMNHYLSLSTPLQPVEHRVDLDVTVQLQPSEHQSITIGFGYDLFNRYPVWDRVDPDGYSTTNPDFTLVYDDEQVSTRSVYLTMSQGVSGGVVITGRLTKWWSTYRGSERVPYFPSHKFTVTYDIPPYRKIKITPTISWVGERRTGVVGTAQRRLSGYALLDLEGTYPITGKLSAGVWLYNLFYTKYQRWEGFTEPGLTLAFGLVNDW